MLTIRRVASTGTLGAALAVAAAADAQVQYQTVALRGQAAPGPAGASFMAFDGPSINNGGQLLFSGRIGGGGIHPGNDDVLYTGPAGALQLVARAGSAAPGLPAGVNYARFHNEDFLAGSFFFGEALINDGGQIAYLAELTGGGVTTANNVVNANRSATAVTASASRLCSWR